MSIQWIMIFSWGSYLFYTNFIESWTLSLCALITIWVICPIRRLGGLISWIGKCNHCLLPWANNYLVCCFGLFWGWIGTGCPIKYMVFFFIKWRITRNNIYPCPIQYMNFLSNGQLHEIISSNCSGFQLITK